jgi:AhpD family alkylhydroperoxidase
MSSRISIKDLEPGAYEAMYALENYTKGSDLPPLLTELIKIRASQLNGCAYCVEMHVEDALALGETERRIFVLPVWKESHLFSEEERAVLELTEEITLLSVEGLRDETYEKVKKYFSDTLLAQMIMQVVVINAWNRISVTTKAIYKP